MIQIILNICLAEDHKYAIIKQKIITITVNWELNETLKTYSTHNLNRMNGLEPGKSGTRLEVLWKTNSL